ncbi:hypothetical protein LDENG_00289920 [Lucifuga dentata]|nr:hypothetical protein LDENG_00289920 [Lucifuga dentata]
MMSSFGKSDGFLCGWNLWRSLLNLIVFCVLQHFCLLAGRMSKCDGCCEFVLVSLVMTLI